MVHKASNDAAVPPPVSRYTHLNSVPADHELVLISGQVGNLPDGSLAGEDAQTQAAQVFANIEALLRGIGATPAHLLKFTSFVVGRESLAAFREARDRSFDAWYPEGTPVPGHTLAIVAGLADPRLLVEVEAVAAVPRAAQPTD
ncbi:RidA family protein [Actinacidiphila yeochonensis]|uniref:RidA family protein n=1 Tax=Actinacidiphila yeochonensis TaxID=89050 RepID=UPI000566D8A9|nr:RidA family protein [Actinacidiphila yeochonensis]